MSFFIKNKRKNGFKPPQPTKKKPKPDDEITSESDAEESHDDHNDSDSDETETAQDKRVKLAKLYLEEIQRLEHKDADEVTQKLRDDYLIETGRFRSSVADLYLQPDDDSSPIIRNKCHKLSVTCVCVSHDSKLAFSGSKDGGIIKWSLPERKKITSVCLSKKKIVCLAISDDFRFLAVGDSSNDILIHNPETLQRVHTFRGHRGPITSLVFRKNAPLVLYSCSADKSVKTWSLEEFSYLETLFGHQDVVTHIDALAKERAVTSGGADSTLRLWKIPEESQLIFNGSDNIDCVKFINDDQFVSGSDAGELSVWSALKKKPLCSVKCAHGSGNWVTCIAAFVNTDLVASGSNDGFVRFWKLSSGCRHIEPLFAVAVEGFVNCLAFSDDGRWLVVAVGQEHRCGRWITNKAAKNGICIIPLIKHEKQ